MSPVSGHTGLNPSVSPAQQRRGETTVADFQIAWQGGSRPDLRIYLSAASAAERAGLFRDLLRLDVDFRRRAGETPQLSDYAAFLPEFETEIRDSLASDPGATVLQPPADPADTVNGDSPDLSAPLETTIGYAEPPSSAASQPRFGRYEILGEIARGGMGVIYKAVDRQLDRLVALKLIKSGELADAEQIQRFQVEAKAAAQLDHPGIVPVYEVGQFGQQHFMAMAFIDGHSLWQEVKESPLAPKRAAQLMQQVAEAVQYAHERGIVHRDLKPQNILLTKDGQPKVTDFGLAKRQESDSSLTETGEALGTPSYMPPEQAQGKIKHVGPLSDVYSLGATLYCLLTGRPPFQAATQLETMLQVVEQEPVSPKSLNRAVSVDLETICLKCLEKDPAKRYATAGSLADDLGRYLNGEPIQARPVGRLEQVLKWIARKPVTAAAYGLTALTTVLLVIGVTISIFWRNAESARAEAETARNEAVEARQQTEVALQGEKSARTGEEQARTELEESKARNQYVLNVRLAPSLWDSGWVTDARQALVDCPPALRQWEWKYYQRKFHTELATMEGHALRILDLKLSPDERYLGTSRIGVRIWDASTGREATVLTDMRDVGDWISFSPDGSRLAAGSDNDFPGGNKRKDNVLFVWDLQRHQHELLLAQRDGIKSIAYNPDGTRLAAGLSDGAVRLWNSPDLTEIPVKTKHLQAVDKMVFLANGQLASASQGGEIKLWETESGRELGAVRGPTARVALLVGSTDGRELASIFFDGTVKWWDVSTHRELASFKLESPRRSGQSLDVDWVDMSADQRRLVVRWDSTTNVKIFDARSGAALHQLTGLKGIPVSVKCSPENQRVVAGTQIGEIGIWDMFSGLHLGTFVGHVGKVFTFAFSRDGTRLYSGDSQGVARSWDLTAQPDVAMFSTPITAISFDGRLAAQVTEQRVIRLHNLITGEELVDTRGQTGVISKVAFDPFCRSLAAGEHEGTVQLWEFSKEVEPIALRGHSGRINCLEFSQDGRLLTSAGMDGTIKIWNTTVAREIAAFQGHARPVLNVTFNSKGDRLASISSDGTVILWNVLDGQQILKHTWESPPGMYNHCPLIFSPDNAHLACARNERLTIWDTTTLQEIRSVKTPHIVTSMAFSPDSRLLSYGGWFSRVHICDLPSRSTVAEIGSAKYDLVRFSPDGTRLLTAAVDNSIRIWDTKSWQEVAALTGHQLPVFLLQYDANGNRLVSASPDGTVRSWIAEESLEAQAERLRVRPLVWRLGELKRAEETQNWYAAAFHLGWLLQDQPDDDSLKSRYDQALAKLKDAGIAPPPQPLQTALPVEQ